MTELTLNRTPVIHIGMPKCATKTLQWRLFAEHSQVYYLGRYGGHLFRPLYRGLRQCRNDRVRELMDEIAYDPKRLVSPNFTRCCRLADEILSPAQDFGIVPVWSWESYATDSLYMRTMRARNLRRVFGKAIILMTIRHPITLLESAFLQQVKRDNIGVGYSFGRAAFYCSIDEWVEREWDSEVKYHLDYTETIRIYIDLFGVENVHVLLFEELCEDSQAYYAHVCDIMGIDVEQGLKLVAGHRDNTRWTKYQLDRLADIKRNPIKALHYRFLTRQKRRSLLGIGHDNVPHIRGERAPIHISDDWRDKILSLTRCGHKWLERSLNLPLTKYGYIDS